jgi:hypothetical protein
MLLYFKDLLRAVPVERIFQKMELATCHRGVHACTRVLKYRCLESD